MTQSELEQLRVKIKQDYVKLLDLLARVLNKSSPLSTTDLEDRERLSMALGLTDKFVNHAVTLLYLSRGTKQDLPLFKFDTYLYDFASIDVLTRVLLEACLTFHYVFYSPSSKDEKDYRFWAYKVAATLEKRSFPALTEKFKEKLVEEEKEFDKLRGKLKSNAVFKSLSDKQKGQILRGKWKLKHYREIAIDAGFSRMIAEQIYKHLSGIAHSSFLSILQSVEIQTTKNQEEAIISSMWVANAVIAKMVMEFCGLFPRARNILSVDHDGLGIVDWWIRVDHGLDEFANIG